MMAYSGFCLILVGSYLIKPNKHRITKTAGLSTPVGGAFEGGPRYTLIKTCELASFEL